MDVEPLDDFFQKYVYCWMWNDIETAINGDANLLAVLGINAYADFIGDIYISKLKSNGRGYTEFLYLMNCKYKTQEKKLKKIYYSRRKHNYAHYDIIRSGLVHNYFLKESGYIFKWSNDSPKGIHLNEKSEIIISLNKLFEEFKEGCKKCHNIIKEDHDKINFFNTDITNKINTISGNIYFHRGNNI